MTELILAIDQGTTGSTAVLLTRDSRIVAKANEEFPQHYPRSGWVEHDLDEVWASVKRAVSAALAESPAQAKDIVAIGITNQRETTVVWDRHTGHPIHHAIVWQDRRTADRCVELRGEGHEARIRERTGLVLDPYFSGTKIAWILDYVEGARERAKRGELAFGTIDSWLVNKLTGGEVHVTDVSNASRTMLLDLATASWDDELCELLRVPKSVLPEVRGSSEIYGRTRGFPGLPDGIPIAGIAGDQQAALFGQTCFEVGDVKCTYGTGAFILMNTGTSLVRSNHGLLSTIAWRIGSETTYALEGSSFIAGAAVQWLRDGLGIIRSSAEVEAMASRVESSGDVVFVPALAGLGAPHWDPGARGLIWGLTRDTTAAHLCRAALEGIAFQVSDLAFAMAKDLHKPLGRLRVDGGAAANDLLMQFQADILQTSIDRPVSVETTALGAAYLAGLAVGVFRSPSDIVRHHRMDKTFHPRMSEETREVHLRKWRRAVERARSERGSA